ncbi:receptor-like protein EIX2 [Gossypium hirsutum]|uniref:Receptor-like protein EIX2 n=1 Tax=Gossypium hirsutum TaxID=3635 RepID=A0A1U8IIZ5_GOSHI|nr:receptor-like protein EIX2 [Gossypium hirsutum]
MAIIILLVLIILAIADVNSNNEISSNSYSGCPENEKQALLVFKEGLIDDANRLASWDPHHHPDCCIWFGVVCGNMTGHILSLNLSFPPLDDIVDIDSYLMSMLKGKINPCLSNLKHLRYLDLSNNAFEGLLPYQLGNLSNLESLNLRGEDKFNEAGLLYVENLQWLSGLSLLKHLDLSLVDLSRASNWLQLVNTRLPSLEELHLSNCFLQLGRPLLNVNLSTLAVLDLSYNFFTNQMNLGWVSKLNSLVVLNLAGSDISSAIFNISTLNELYLSWNDLEGKLPRAVGKLCNLRFESLAFASCQLSGQLTDQLEHFKNLKELSLNDNSIFGPIPTSLGKLANLEKVEIYNNLLEGVVSEKHFANHTKLRFFEGSDNSLVLRANPYWLNAIIGTRVLSLANNLLSGEIPDCWFKSYD